MDKKPILKVFSESFSRDRVSATMSSTWTKNDLDVADYKCLKHTVEKVQGYCKSCDVPVCIQCILTKCNGHTFNNINSAMREKQDTVLCHVVQMEENKLPLLEQKIAECDEKSNENDMVADKNMDAVLQRAKVLKNKIDTAVSRLNEAVELSRKRNQTKITATKYPLQTCYREMTSMVREYKEKLKAKPDLSVMLMERDILKAMREVENKAVTAVPRIDVPYFFIEESTEILNTIEKMMGRMMYEEEE